MRFAETERGRRRVIFASAVSLGVAFAGLATAAPAVADSDLVLPELEEIYMAEPGAPQEAERIYLTLELEVFSADPARWGGAYIDGANLVVVYVGQSQEEASRILARFDIVPGRDAVVLEQAEHSIKDLSEATSAVFESAAADVNARVTSVGPQYSSNRLVVGIDSGVIDSRMSSADMETTISRWQEVAGDIEVELFNHSAPETRDSRYWFYNSVYGGGRLGFSGTGGSGGCSVGFGWQSGGLYALSASHCMYPALGAATRPNVATSESPGTGDIYGSVTWSSGTGAGSVNSDGDFLRITPVAADPRPPAGRIWTGNGDSTTYRDIIGQAEIPEGWTGSNLRTSGSSGFFSGNPAGDGERAPDWVSLVDQTVVYSDEGQTYTGMTIAEHVESCVVDGDSGGSVYLQSGSSSAYAVGIISGSKTPAPGPLNCRNYYTPISVITAALGGTVIS